MRPVPRILLIDPVEHARTVLAERLLLQGFSVVECRDGAEGAVRALEEPPLAVVADLSMPSISGVQLCRLLRSEGGTAHVPVILRGSDDRRNHFWAEQAGAYAYVVKGRMGELVRALRKAIDRPADVEDAAFFVVSSTEGLDVRERIAAHLDAALFDSVIAAEVRRLGSSESFDRLLDLLSQFVSQVTTYRWLAVSRNQPPRIGLHTNAACRAQAVSEARAALGVPDAPLVTVEDDDAVGDELGPPALCEPIVFGELQIGSIALGPRAPVHANDPPLVRTIARELGGALRMASLVEESRQLATTDVLTGLMNRRAFMDWAARAQRRAASLGLVMLDVDHFKQINDKRGHATGDLVLAHLGRMLSRTLRDSDVVARWGGEEFVIALPDTPLAAALEVAEHVRVELARAVIVDSSGQPLPVTASLGVAELVPDESVEHAVDRADRAMYTAKSSGRNRVAGVAGGPEDAPFLHGPGRSLPQLRVSEPNGR
jgi:two-component system, cell cycle response regulator